MKAAESEGFDELLFLVHVAFLTLMEVKSQQNKVSCLANQLKFD
jgi:hypothetical protein